MTALKFGVSLGALALASSGLSMACSGEVQIGDVKTDAGVPTHDSGAPHEDGAVSDGGASEGSTIGHESDTGSTGHDAGSAGKLLVGTADLSLYGVTSDGYAVYSLATTLAPTLLAVPLAGGTPITIGTMSGYTYVDVTGDVAVIYDNIGNFSDGEVSTWSSKTPLQKFSSTSVTYSAQIDAASGTIAYFDNFNTSAGTADAYVSKLDGSGVTLLHSGVSNITTATECYPELTFVGTTVALAFCPTVVGTANIYSYAPPTWQETSLSTTAYPYLVPDPAGQNLLVLGDQGGLSIMPVSGGAATTIDPLGNDGAFTSDGQTVVYTTSSGMLRSAKVASPNPTTLVPSGVESFYSLSPDNSTALVYNNFDSTTRLFDLYAASTSAPGSLVPLNTSNTTDALYGNTFTGDSSHIFFYTAVNPSSFLGTLQGSAASSASQQPTVLGTTSNTAWAVGKTSVAFADNVTTPPGSSLNSIDIEVVDLAGTGKPTRVATEANATSSYPSFFVNPAGDAVVYTINAMGGVAPGLYVTPLP